jgi:methionyl-tRNA formyltransferase
MKIRDRRRTLELARSRTADDLARATAASHREMLQQALAALDEQLQQLSPPENGRT